MPLAVNPAETVEARLALSQELDEPECDGYAPAAILPGDWKKGKATVSWRLVGCGELWGWFLTARGEVLDAQPFDKHLSPGRLANVALIVDCFTAPE